MNVPKCPKCNGVEWVAKTRELYYEHNDYGFVIETKYSVCFNHNDIEMDLPHQININRNNITFEVMRYNKSDIGG